MTIGVGLLCNDGIVLASDTEYTTGVLTTLGPKIFKATQRSDVVVIVAGAGRVPFMKAAVEKIGKKVSQLPADPSTEDVKDAAEDALLSFYTKHVYPVPEDIRPEFDLILGVWASDGLQLYNTDLTTLIPVWTCPQF